MLVDSRKLGRLRFRDGLACLMLADHARLGGQIKRDLAGRFREFFAGKDDLRARIFQDIRDLWWGEPPTNWHHDCPQTRGSHVELGVQVRILAQPSDTIALAHSMRRPKRNDAPRILLQLGIGRGAAVLLDSDVVGALFRPKLKNIVKMSEVSDVRSCPLRLVSMPVLCPSHIRRNRLKRSCSIYSIKPSLCTRSALAHNKPDEQAERPRHKGREQYRRLQDAREILGIRVTRNPQSDKQIERQIVQPSLA